MPTVRSIAHIVWALGACATIGCEASESESSESSPVGDKADDADAACGAWDGPIALGRVEDGRASRLSGLSVSWREPSVVWGVNDSPAPNTRRLFAFDRSGRELETYKIAGTVAQEFEDLATDGESLYLVDGAAAPGSISILRVAEPDIHSDDALAPAETFSLSSDVPLPVHSIFVLADEGSLYALTKDEQGATLLRTALPLQPGGRFEIVVDHFDNPALRAEIVGADATSDGRHIAFKPKDGGVRIWHRDADDGLADVLQTDSCDGPGAAGKDRAVALEPGGAGYLLAPDDETDHAVLFAARLPTACPEFGDLKERGRAETPSAIELSGLAVSRRHPDVLWAHNDGGEGEERNVLVALDTSGNHLGDFALEDVENQDWEDIAIGPTGPGEPDMIYIGDIGDNSMSRDTVRLIRVPEPDVSDGGEGQRSSVVGHQEFELRYPRGEGHNAESLAIDPETGDVIIVTKRNEHDFKTRVYIARAPLVPGETNRLKLLIRERPGSSLDARFVAADFSWDGMSFLAQVDDRDSLIWPRHPGESWASALTWPACAYDAPAIHIESAAFDAEGGYWMVPEGLRPPLLQAQP